MGACCWGSCTEIHIHKIHIWIGGVLCDGSRFWRLLTAKGISNKHCRLVSYVSHYFSFAYAPRELRCSWLAVFFSLSLSFSPSLLLCLPLYLSLFFSLSLFLSFSLFFNSWFWTLFFHLRSHFLWFVFACRSDSINSLGDDLVLIFLLLSNFILATLGYCHTTCCACSLHLPSSYMVSNPIFLIGYTSVRLHAQFHIIAPMTEKHYLLLLLLLFSYFRFFSSFSFFILLLHHSLASGSFSPFFGVNSQWAMLKNRAKGLKIYEHNKK